MENWKTQEVSSTKTCKARFRTVSAVTLLFDVFFFLSLAEAKTLKIVAISKPQFLCGKKQQQSVRVHLLYGYGNAWVSNISFEFSKQLSPSVKGGCFPAEKSAAYTSAECGDLTLVRVLSRCRLARLPRPCFQCRSVVHLLEELTFWLLPCIPRCKGGFERSG